jgi:hypothetical protein
MLLAARLLNTSFASIVAFEPESLAAMMADLEHVFSHVGTYEIFTYSHNIVSALPHQDYSQSCEFLHHCLQSFPNMQSILLDLFQGLGLGTCI